MTLLSPIRKPQGPKKPTRPLYAYHCSKPGGLVHVRLRRRLPVLVNSNLLVSNDRLESRMRENRRTGSEGGEPPINAAFLPLSL